MYYLLEWSYQDYQDCEVFDKLDGLTETLQLELESAWEHDDIFDVLYIGIYERGTLKPLMLFLEREVPELDDFIDRHYEIRNTALEVVDKFVVRIDGRNL
jgi:hypothetical protein